MASGAVIEFGADISDLVSKMGRVEIAISRVEKSLESVSGAGKRAEKSQKDLGDTAKRGADKSAEAMDGLKDSIETVVGVTTLAIAAMIKLEQHANKAGKTAQDTAQSFYSAMAATGNTAAAPILEDRFFALSKKTGTTIDKLSQGFQTVSQRGYGNAPGTARAVMSDLEEYAYAADVYKMDDEKTQQFFSAAATMRKQAPNLNAKQVAGYVGAIYRTGTDVSQISGLMEGTGATPEQMVGFARTASLSGADIGMFNEMAGRIESARDDTVKVKSPSGIEIETLKNPWMKGLTSAQIIEQGLLGKRDLSLFAGRGSAAKWSDMVRSKRYQSSIQGLGAEENYATNLDAAQGRHGNVLGVAARTSEQIDDLKAKEEVARIRMIAEKQAALRKQATIQAEGAKGFYTDTIMQDQGNLGSAARAFSFMKADFEDFLGNHPMPNTISGMKSRLSEAKRSLSRMEQNYENDPNVYGSQGNRRRNASPGSPASMSAEDERAIRDKIATQIRAIAPGNMMVEITARIIKGIEPESPDAQ